MATASSRRGIGDTVARSRASASAVSEDTSLASQMEQFSANLISLSKSLDSAVKKFESIADKFSKSMSDTVEDYDDILNDNNEKGLKNLSLSYQRQEKISTEGMTRFQKVSSVFVKTFEAAGRILIKEFTTAITDQTSSYEQHLSTVTARMQLSNNQYFQKINESSRNFMRQGMERQWSGVDFTNALVEALDTGLRGTEAESQAYHTLVANRLVPALSTNTRAYISMSKQFGKSFQENAIAMAKHTEATLGAQGIEEGKLTSMMNTLEGVIKMSAQGDSEKAQAVYNNMTSMMAALEDKGINTDYIIQQLHAAATQIGETDLLMQTTGMTTPRAVMEMISDSDKFNSWLSRYLNTAAAQAQDVNSTVGLMGNGLGQDMDFIYQVAGAKFGKGGIEGIIEAQERTNASYNKDRIIAEETRKLQKGFYQTADDALTNLERNQTTEVATLGASIPRVEEKLEVLKVLVGSILTSITANTISNLVGGQGGTDVKGLAKFFNKVSTAKGGATGYKATSDAVKSVLGTAAPEGAKGLGVIKGTTAAGTALNIAAGPVALAAGGLWMAKDGLSSAKRAKEDGRNGWEVVGQAYRSAYTGRKYMTDTEKIEATNSAMLGQKRSMDWGAVAANAGKGALVGAGVGTAAAGWAAGTGTAIGAAVGTVVGAATSIVDQAIENAKYNKLADAANDFTKSMESATKSTDAFLAARENEKNTLELIDIVLKKVPATASQQEEALRQLTKAYPAQLAGITEITAENEKYLDNIREQASLDSNIAFGKALQDNQTTFDSLGGIFDAFEGIEKDKVANEAVLQFANELASSGGEDGSIANDPEKLKKLIEEYSAKAGVSEEEFFEMTKSLGDGGLLSKGAYEKTMERDPATGRMVQRLKKVGEYSVAGNDKYSLVSTFGDNTKQAVARYGSDGYSKKLSEEEKQRTQQTVINTINSAYTNINESIRLLQEMFDSYAVEDGNGNYDFSGVNSTQRLAAIADLEELDKAVLAYNYNIKRYNVDNPPITSDQYPWLKNAASALGFTPSFKVGTLNVTDDGLASLHKGEAVLTTAEAEDLRGIMSSGGVSGLFKGILGLVSGRASARNAAQDPTTDVTLVNVVQSIKDHSIQMTSLLNQIIDQLSVMAGRGQSGSSAFSEAVISFSGY